MPSTLLRLAEEKNSRAAAVRSSLFQPGSFMILLCVKNF